MVRKPLIVMTPKSLLRHPRVVSTLDELANGRFERIIGDTITDRSVSFIPPPGEISVRVPYELVQDVEVSATGSPGSMIGLVTSEA